MPVNTRSALVLAGLIVLTAGRGEASSVLPPTHLGELAAVSDAVVLATAGAAQASHEGALIVTRTSFTVVAAVAGELSDGDRLVVEAPGGFTGGSGWLVAGSPRFLAGETYLLFLAHGTAPGRWQPRALSYGLLRRTRGADGSTLLSPLAEASDVQALARPGAVPVEPIGTYREEALLASLHQVVEGTGAWDSDAVHATPEQLPLRASAAAIPLGCGFLRYPDPDTGTPLRWSLFDGGGTATFYAQAGGDPSLAGDEARLAVAEALATWMGVPGTGLSLVSGGELPHELACSGSRDMPPMGANIVIFDDPCDDIPDLVDCNGTLAFGGPWFSGTHTFDGEDWNTIRSAFTIVNNGTGCLGAEGYSRLLSHELGHGLGLAHSPDPNALMYRFCCNSITPGDAACVRFAYPADTPPAPGELEASDGAFMDRVRVTWSASPGATSYELWRASSSALAMASLAQEITALSWDDVAATPGIVYSYWVRARNGLGASAFGGPDSGFIAPCAPPQAPAISSPPTVRSGDSFQVSWTRPGSTEEVLLQEATDPAFTASTSARLSGFGATFLHAAERTRTYYYRVRSLASCRGGEIASPWSATAATQVVNPGATLPGGARLDFGTAVSPVAPGYTRVTPETTYTSESSFGWANGDIAARDRGLGSSITRDLNFATSATFLHDLANGLYEVSLVLGDASHDHDHMGVLLQGEHVDTISTEQGHFILRAYPVLVDHSQLSLTLEDLGGDDPNVVITGLTVAPLPTRRYDFGTASSILAPAHTQITPATRYSPASGHGWFSGTLGARDRGNGPAQDRDFNFTSYAVFAVDIPNGTYDVTVRMGDAAFGHDDMGVSLESARVGSVSTQAGELAVETYRVTVGDGQLTFTLEDLGGHDAYATINALEVAPSPAPDLVAMLPGGVPLYLARVPAGSFVQGSPGSERGRLDDEGPQRHVTVWEPLLVGRHEITRRQWMAVMGDGASESGSADEDLPIVGVSWDDIAGTDGFLERLNRYLQATGQPGAGVFRLPTEVEWEWAARAASRSRFAFGDILGCDDGCGDCETASDHMWWCSNTGGAPQPVASTLPNGFGLWDLHGNAEEWVQDAYDSYSADQPAVPDGRSAGAFRSRRGGAFDLPAHACRSAARSFALADHRSYNAGFRIVVSESRWLADSSPANARVRRRH